MGRQIKLAGLAAVMLAAGMALAENQPLAGTTFSTKGGAKAEAIEGGVHLRINSLRGASLQLTPPPAGHWDLSKWRVLAVDVENLSSEVQSRLLMSISTDGIDRPTAREVNVGIALNPGEKRTMRIELPHHWKYAAPDHVPGPKALDTTKVIAIEFFVQWPYENAKAGLVDCRLTNVRVEEPVVPTKPRSDGEYLPFIDEYGQFIHDQWPAKIKSADELQANLAKEIAEFAGSKRPDQWNRFGGWANGPQLKATGSFRVEKYQGKWYFVDPEGRLFFSHGIDVLSTYNDPLKVLPGKENWFKTLPEGAKTYQPTELALTQKYGTDQYRPAYFANLQRRLEHWGINTIGDWGRSEIMDLGKTPYTLQITDYDWKMPRIGASKLKFYDVFDPAYLRKFETLIPDAAAKSPILQKSLTDPMCIGYFIDNELNYGNRDSVVLVDDVLKCPSKQAMKQELVKDLKTKYDTIAKLNDAWKTDHADWDALLAATTVIPTTDAYKEDAKVFIAKAVDQYFKLARDAIKRVAPDRLYLGSRFISTDAVRKVLADASQKYCDVLTVNIYSHSAANFPVDSMPDMPVLIGEFHFGVLDRGMFSASLARAGITQEDRALAYTRFMQGVLVHQNFVGAHWFQYRDQPLTGRGDSEAYQIGFVDVADTPYAELARAARTVGEHMYTYRATGKLQNDMAPAK